MHSAPTVSYPVGPSAGAGRLLAVLWLLGMAAAILACVQSYTFGWRQLLLLASAGAAGALAWHGLRRAGDAAELRFDGRAWSLSGRSALRGARARLALDLQSLLLLRLEPDPAREARWIWLDRRLAPACWSDLRRALHASGAPIARAPEGS